MERLALVSSDGHAGIPLADYRPYVEKGHLADLDDYEMEMRYEIGVDSMMYGLDYPHPEGPWGQSRTWLQATLGKAGVSEDEARKVLGENAASLYHVDLAALAPVIERIGPTADEVLQVPTDAQLTALMSDMTSSGRELAARQYGLIR